MALVVPMTPMHEEVHQWTGQQDQIRECAQYMGTAFLQQEVAGDAAYHHQAQRMTRTPVTLGSPLSMMVMIHFFLQKSRLITDGEARFELFREPGK